MSQSKTYLQVNAKGIKMAIIAMAIFTFSHGLAQNNPWQAKQALGKGSQLAKNPGLFTLQTALLAAQFGKAPLRTAKDRSNILIDFPDMDGNFKTYNIYKSQILHPDLAAKYPDLNSFVGKSGQGDLVHFSYAETMGLKAYFQRPGKEDLILSPQENGGSQDYVLYAPSLQENNIKDALQCNLEETMGFGGADRFGTSPTARNANDGYLRKYRLAVSVTGEYANYFLDGTEIDDNERKAKVMAAIVATMTHVNMVFERDFGVTMQIVPNNDEVLYLDANTDPYTDSNSWNYELQHTLDTILDAGSYDVGHLFTYSYGNYGNAGCIACVCSNGQKGSAFSAHTAPETASFDLLVMHEMGHQFGSYHVMSSCRSGYLSEVEPGSGSTIMSYAGVCNPNVQQESDAYFNYVNLRDVGTWTIEHSSCAELIPIDNAAPVANAGNDYTLPVSTPFALKGSASDPDTGDNLTYSWEQNDPEDPGSTAAPDPSRTLGPMFRSRPPTQTPVRYMPQMPDILNNNLTPTWEVLPSVGRTMEFAFTVRDNGPQGGQTASDLMQLEFHEGAGPFVVNSPSNNVTWISGDLVTVNWDVAQTDRAPVSTAFVSVLLSANGGESFDHVLLESTPNDGTETFVLPFVPNSEQARIMVKAVDNIFFALNPSFFTTQNSEFLWTTDQTTSRICQGSTAQFHLTYLTYSGFSENVAFTAENLPPGTSANITPTSVSGEHQEGSLVTVTVENAGTLPAGSYDFNIVGTSGALVKRLPLRIDVYDTAFDIPVPLSPAPNETGVPLDGPITWESATNAHEYVAEIATDTNFLNIVETYSGTEPGFRPLLLEYDTPYFFRAKSSNPCGESVYSQVVGFRTQCPAPSGFDLISATAHNITLQWDDLYNGSWEVEYGAAGFTPGTGTVLTTTGNTLTVANLDSATYYDFFLRAICGNGDVSSVPWPLRASTTPDYCAGDVFFDSGGPYGNYPNNEYKITVISPDSPNDRVRVRFSFFLTENDYDYLVIYDGDSIDAPLIGAFTGWRSIPDMVSTHDSGALTFLFISDASLTYYGWEATVTCEPKPICPAPSNLEAINIASNSALLNWQENGASPNFILEYGPQGFLPGSGEIVAVNAYPPFLLDGLAERTTYDIYVKANCFPDGASDSSLPVQITTPCAPIAAPYLQSFTDTLPDCWEHGEANKAHWQFLSDSAVLHDGNTHNLGQTYSDGPFAFIDASGDHSTGTTLVSPPVSMTGITNPGLSFYLIAHSESGNVNFSVDVFDGNQWHTAVFQNEQSTAQWQKIYVDLSLLEFSGPARVRFVANNGADFPYNLALDDVYLGEIPNCIPPYFVKSGTQVSSSSITLSWKEAGNATRWTLEYGPQGFAPGNGSALMTTEQELTFEALESNTAYDFYVYSDCGNGVTSTGTPAYTVKTDADHCGGDHFYDSGGPNGNYGNSENLVKTIEPASYGTPVQVDFLSLDLANGDILYVYNGPDTNAPLLGTFTGNLLPPKLISTHASGALSFVFVADGSVTASGWDAVVSCGFVGVTNFQISATGASCKTANDGSIAINASKTDLNYIAFLEGNADQWELAFTETVSFNGLDAGSYSLCIAVENYPGFSQCYTITIEAPEDLIVSSAKNTGTDKVNLQLSGGEKYWITLNGKEFTTRSSTYDLDLQYGENIIQVRTDKDCQGFYEEKVYLVKDILVYPNPIATGDLKIQIPVEAETIGVQLHSMDNKLVMDRILESGNGIFQLNMDGLPKGTYILSLRGRQNEMEKRFQIIKK